MELIDKQTAIDAICKMMKQFDGNRLQDQFTHNGLVLAKRIIDEQPTIQYEQRSGEWIIKRDEFYTAYDMYYAECSNCKHTESTGMVERLRYCPKCGAYMRDEVSEDADDRC